MQRCEIFIKQRNGFYAFKVIKKSKMFVRGVDGITVDDARRSGTLEKAHKTWKTMVSEKELSGVQLFSVTLIFLTLLCL